MSATFQTPSWVHHTNIYEVNIRQYTPEGTFNAFAKSLSRLKQMGIQTLWFMPITPISQKNKKGSLGSYYACSDYTSINPEFGTMDDFKSLVEQAQEMDFKVIIDWVANRGVRVIGPTGEHSKLAWVGGSFSTTKKEPLRLCLTAIENPQPELEVKTVDLYSCKSRTAPCIMAMTPGKSGLMK